MKAVISLREHCNLSEMIESKRIKHASMCVFKTTEGKFGWYAHDNNQPYAFHDFAQGYDTKEDARYEAMGYVNGINSDYED